ncbi:MAG: hypothetical protein ACI9OJ_003870 [Myxococcota bacterium]|jgi:hypothetical protein
MHARCPRCMTRQRVVTPPAAGDVKRVACASCGAVFGVRGPAVTPAEQPKTAVGIAAEGREVGMAPGASAPQAENQAPPNTRWQVRKTDGTILQFPSLALFRKWVMEGAVALDDELSRHGNRWRAITEIPELVGLFEFATLQTDTTIPTVSVDAPPLPAGPQPEIPTAAPPLPPLVQDIPAVSNADVQVLTDAFEDMPPVDFPGEDIPPIDLSDMDFGDNPIELMPADEPAEPDEPAELTPAESVDDPGAGDVLEVPAEDSPVETEFVADDGLELAPAVTTVDDSPVEPGPTADSGEDASLAAFPGDLPDAGPPADGAEEDVPAATEAEPTATEPDADSVEFAAPTDVADDAPFETVASTPPTDEPKPEPTETDSADEWSPSLSDFQDFDAGPPPSDDGMTLQDFHVGALTDDEEMDLAGLTMELRAAPPITFEIGKAVEFQLAERDAKAEREGEDNAESDDAKSDDGKNATAETLAPIELPEEFPLTDDETSRLGLHPVVKWGGLLLILAALGAGGWWYWQDLQKKADPTWPDSVIILHATARVPVTVHPAIDETVPEPAVAVPEPVEEPVVELPPAEPRDMSIPALRQARLGIELKASTINHGRSRAEIRAEKRAAKNEAAAKKAADKKSAAGKPADKKVAAGTKEPTEKPPVEKPGEKGEPKLIAASGDSYDALMSAAGKARKAGKTSAEIGFLQKASARNPRSVEPIAKLGWAYLRQNNATAAIIKFQEAKGKNPGYRDTYIGLAKSLERAGRTGDAIAVYRQYLRMCPACRKAKGVRASLVRLGAEP